MPIIDYKCQKCGTVYDILSGMTADKEPIQCPSCSTTEGQDVVPPVTSKPIIR